MIKVVTYNNTFTFKNEKELDAWYDKQPESFDLASVIRIEYDNPVDKAYSKYLSKKHNKENK